MPSASSPPIVFLAPAPRHGAEGGHAYVARMAAALRAAGHAAEILPPAAARPGNARVVVDGLALPMLDPLPEGAAVLVHHTAPGQDEAAREALRRALPRSSPVIATGPATAARLAEEFGAAPGRIVVVPPGVDDAPRSAGSGGPGCHVLAVGALVPRKGHDLLLRALARLFDLDWRLTVAGSASRDPAHARALEALAEELGIAGRVTLAGAVDDAALDALWRGADLFASASRWEGHDATVMGALRRGLPVAVSAAAGARVPPGAGVVCPDNDADALSKAMRRLVFAPALRADMAEAAWRAGQRLPGWDEQARRFLEALR